MAYTTDNSATAADITSLKTSVNAEMKRRKYSSSGPSLSAYEDSFTTAASAGVTIGIDHFNKTVGHINRIKATGLTASSGSTLDAINTAITKLNAYKQTSDTATTSDCSSGCTGLCYTGCGSGCKGCTGSCSGSCSGGCTNCTGTCSGGCAGCMGTCKGGCTGCGAVCSLAHVAQ